MSAVRKPFDWVAEAGMLRGELLALEMLIKGGAPQHHVLQQVETGLRNSMARLEDHFGPIAPPNLAVVPNAPRAHTGD